ncbi:MAG: insulinase family protein [Cyclobacteriaceae bacterium]
MLDRTVAPKANAIERPNLPVPEKIQLGQVPVTILNNVEQPVILLELVFPLGRWEEPKQGLVFLLFKMMQEGTKHRSAEDIAEILDFHGSFLEVSPSLDAVSIKLYTLNRFFPKLVALLHELLTESIFPQKEFDTLRQIRLEQVKQQHARNDAYANLKFREMLFGGSHPYGQITTEEIVNSISREELVAFGKEALVAPKIFLTGKITDEELTCIRKYFGEMSFHPSVSPSECSIESQSSQHIARGESTQASLRMGTLIIDRNHQDIHQFKIANELLGGFFGSRLMKNIREDKGLTYGIHAGMVHLKHSSYWEINSEVLKDKAQLAFDEIENEVKKLQSESPGIEEFNMVVNYMKGKFLSSFGSPFSAHEMIKGLEVAGLTSSYFEDFLTHLNEMKPEMVSSMINKHIDLNQLIKLQVG